MKKVMVGNHAVSWGVQLARAEVIEAPDGRDYPWRRCILAQNSEGSGLRRRHCRARSASQLGD